MMKDITRNDGSVVTDAEQVAYYQGTLRPDFIPTQEDLEKLADGLADESINLDYLLRLNVCTSWVHEQFYVNFRLNRVWDFLSAEKQQELEAHIKEEIAKNDVYQKEYECTVETEEHDECIRTV
jgi:hypothetical protein